MAFERWGGVVNIIRHGEWSFASRPCRNMPGAVAWCKRGEIVSDSPMGAVGSVWFEFGDTEDQAVAKLMREMGVAS